MVKLTSADGQEFSVPKEVANMSVLIKNMLEDFGEETETPIPLPNVSGQILAKGNLRYIYIKSLSMQPIIKMILPFQLKKT